MSEGVLIEVAARWAEALGALPLSNDKSRKFRLLDWAMREHVGRWMRAAGLGDTWKEHIQSMPQIVDDASLALVIGPQPPGAQWPVLGEGNLPFDYALRAAMAAYEKSGARERLIERRPSAAGYPMEVAAMSGLDGPCSALWTVLNVRSTSVELEIDELARASAYASILFKICTNLLDDETRARTTREAFASIGVFLASLVDDTFAG